MKQKCKVLSAAVLSLAAVALVAADAAKKPAEAAKTSVIPQKDLVSAKASPVKEKKPATFESVLSFLPANVAVIDGKDITKKQFIEHLKGLGATPEVLASLPEAQRKAAVTKAVEQYVDQQVVMSMAKKDGFVPSEKNAREFIDQLIKKTPPAQLANIEAQLKMMGKNLDSYKNEFVKNKNYQEQAAVMMWIEKKFRNSIKVTPEEVEKFYKENKEVFNVPERITASHILIAPDKNIKDKAKADAAAKEKAEKILASLKKGADFGETAFKESACPSGKQNKGSLGTFTKGQMVPEFEKAALALKPGEMSGLVKTQFGYHIIKLTAKTPASVRQLKEVSPEIENYLKEQKCAKALKVELEKTKKEMKVKVHAF